LQAPRALLKLNAQIPASDINAANISIIDDWFLGKIKNVDQYMVCFRHLFTMTQSIADNGIDLS